MRKLSILSLLSLSLYAQGVGAQELDTAILKAPTVSGYCVDSVNGDDLGGANTCTCKVSKNLSALKKGTPCRTIARLLAVAPPANSNVLLARGSHWREMLYMTGWSGVTGGLLNGTSVRAYGAGARPIFDGANTIPAANWTKTVGRTNVYQTTLDTSVVAYGWAGIGMRIWEDWNGGTPGTGMLTRVADVATCDTTPGSWTGPTRPTHGNDVIYVHASDSSSPASNSKVYEWPARPWGVNGSQLAEDAHHLALIEGVETRRHGHHDGGLLIAGVGSVLRDFYQNTGGALPNVDPAHGVWCGGGATCENGEAAEIVSYGNSQPGITVRNVTVNCTSPYVTNDLGIYFHTSVSGGNKWGKMTYQDLTFRNCFKAFGGNAATQVAIIRPIAIDNTVHALASYDYVDRLDIVGARHVRYDDGAAQDPAVSIFNTDAGHQAFIRGSRFVHYQTTGLFNASTTSLGTITLQGNSVIWYGAGASALRTGIYNTATTANVVSERNLWYHPNIAFRLDGASATATVDRNVYNSDAAEWRLAGVTRTWAQWQAAGYDTNGAREATVLAGDATTGDTAPTAASAAWTIGAGADAYGDAHLAEWIAAIP
jgi:hypothetical protein